MRDFPRHCPDYRATGARPDTVSIRKRVNAFKLMMDECHTDRRIKCIARLAIQLIFEIGHQTDSLITILGRHENHFHAGLVPQRSPTRLPNPILSLFQ